MSMTIKLPSDAASRRRRNVLGASVVLFVLVVGLLLAVWLDPQTLIFLGRFKDWQPLIAALVALLAASLAYRGAMAKVDLDREIAGQALTHRHLNLRRRLAFEVNYAKEMLEGLDADIGNRLGFEQIKAGVTALNFSQAPGVTEAWQNIHLLDDDMVDALGRAQTNFRRLELFLASVTSWDKAVADWDKPTETPHPSLDATARERDRMAQGVTQSMLKVILPDITRLSEGLRSAGPR